MSKKLSASEIDGVQYRRAKLWQIILYACNAFVDLEFKENAYLVDGVLVIKLKFDKCEKILLDIDFDYGQCESGKPLKKNVSKPRHMNNIFMYSPTLLKEFIEEY